MKKETILMTILISLFSGGAGTLLSPFFQEKLMNEELRVDQVTDISRDLQTYHLLMSQEAWRLTIAKNATCEELNKIHDSWLLAHRMLSKLLLILQEYYPDNKKLDAYKYSIDEFYQLEIKELGLADRENRLIGQQKISKFESEYMILRREIYKDLTITLF